MRISGQPKQFLDLLNQERDRLGLPVFSVHPTLMSIAKDNARNMKGRRTVTHRYYADGEWHPISYLVVGVYHCPPPNWGGNCVMNGVNQGWKAFNEFRRSPGHWAALSNHNKNLIGVAKAADYWSVCLGS